MTKAPAKKTQAAPGVRGKSLTKRSISGSGTKGKANLSAVGGAARPSGAGKAVGLLSPAEITEVFKRFHALTPEPKGELDYVNPFTLLVAVVLSAQTTDAGVNKATRPVFARADSPQKMLAMGEDAFREAIRTIGLYKTKARNVMALCRLLIERHAGEVPHNRADLEALPGVGRKTANVVLNIAFGQPTMAVDTHVFRVANRMGLSHGKNPLTAEQDLMRVVPEAYGRHAHHWLILHGRYLCKAKNPACQRCPVADLCRYPAKNTENTAKNVTTLTSS